MEVNLIKNFTSSQVDNTKLQSSKSTKNNSYDDNTFKSVFNKEEKTNKASNNDDKADNHDKIRNSDEKVENNDDVKSSKDKDNKVNDNKKDTTKDVKNKDKSSEDSKVDTKDEDNSKDDEKKVKDTVETILINLNQLLQNNDNISLDSSDIVSNDRLKQLIMKSIDSSNIDQNFMKQNSSEISEQLLKLLNPVNGDESLQGISLENLKNNITKLEGKIQNNNEIDTFKSIMSDLINTKSSTLQDSTNNQVDTGKVSTEVLSNNNTPNDDSTTSNEDSESNLFSKENDFLNNLLDDTKLSQAQNVQGNKFVDFVGKTNQIAENTIHATTIQSDFIKSVEYMQLKDIKELSVKIFPRELGSITIKLVSENGMLKANITATKEETANLLNSANIKESLASSQIKIEELSVNIQQDDTTYFKGQFNGGQGSNESSSHRNSKNSSERSNEEEIVDAIDSAESKNSLTDGSISLLI
jgi:flagellar hook-length control protein FliK